MAHTPWRPTVSPWLIALAVMLATFLEVLDTSVANVALPYMAGNLSSTLDEATWVLTSYLVANAVVLPMTGWLSVRFGRKRFLMACVALFTLASAVCGAATSMGALVFWRVVQGAAGGALQPLSQAILMESFPPEKRGVGMAIFGLGVVVAPIIGPTLGGWITDNFSWRWIFYVNLPFGALAMVLCQAFIEDPPYIAQARERMGSVDYAGFGFMALWLASLQIVLDKGQQEDWFNTPWIAWFSLVSAASFVAFVVWELRAKEPIVNLRVLGNRNFAMGTAMMTLLGMVLYGSISLLPMFLQSLMSYSALDSGLAMSPRGFGAVVAMILVGKLLGKVEPRVFIGCGFLCLGLVCFRFAGINLDISMQDIVVPNIAMGLSMGIIFVPLTTMAMGDLPNHQMGNASGIFNLMRNLGGSIGISAVTTMVSRGTQTHQAYLVEHLNATSTLFQQYLREITNYMQQFGDPVAAKLKALAVIQALLTQQASMMAYIDNFHLLGVLCLCCLPGVALLRQNRGKAGDVPMH